MVEVIRRVHARTMKQGGRPTNPGQGKHRGGFQSEADAGAVERDGSFSAKEVERMCWPAGSSMRPIFPLPHVSGPRGLLVAFCFTKSLSGCILVIEERKRASSRLPAILALCSGAGLKRTPHFH